MSFIKYLEDKRVQFIGLIIVLIFFYFRTINNENRMDIFKEKGFYTTGKIIDHNISGFSENFYIKYLYVVNEKEYIETINYSLKYRDCYKTRKCIGKKFVVYYNPKDPKEAYIDFDDER